MRSLNELKKSWDDHVSRGLVIKDAGLVLGADTILVRMGETRSGAKALAVEADRERLRTLLSVSYWVDAVDKADEERGEAHFLVL